jgi:outer membrane biosynthesis protein TonB
VRLSDELAKRRLVTSRELPSQPPRPELLTNTVLRVVVGADGLVASAIQVKQPPGSGSEKADREALDFAKAMRFAPLPAGTLTPSIGTIVFEWHIAPTNSPSGTR